MSVLFLIGNGFDLNCGMKTSYRNVYDEYIKTDSSSNLIKQFKEKIGREYDKWGDFEMAMASEYAPEVVNVDDFMECVTDFTIYLRQYLTKQEEDFNNTINNSGEMELVKKEMLYSFSSFYEGITNNLTNKLISKVENSFPRIISFNYTKVFDNIFYNLYGKGRVNPVIHVHGDVEEPIIGIDNIQQIEAPIKESYRLERGFVKPEFNRQYDNNRVNTAERLIENADVICVYGMSLGESDLTWRNHLINWLHTGDKELVLYDYEASRDKSRTVPERMDKEDARKDKILYGWGVDDVDGIRPNVHIPIGKNIFNIKEVLENHRHLK